MIIYSQLFFKMKFDLVVKINIFAINNFFLKGFKFSID